MLLKEPVKIKNLEIANRLVLPPMHTGKCPDGKVPPELCEYYVRRAANGAVGLIITEFSYVSRQGRATPVQLSLASDSDIEGHKTLVNAIHTSGSKVFSQINHAGAAAQAEVTGCEAVAPSAVRSPRAKESVPLPRELTVEEIHQIEDDYVAAAVRSKAAGYDGVEIHGAHGYLYNQFFSPLMNHRHDEYGSDTIESRVRIFIETIQKIRSVVGEAYPIAVRLGGCDYMDGGSTISDCANAARLLVEAGCDYMDISGGMCGTMNPYDKAPGYFWESSKAVKDMVDVPVLLTGGVTTAEQAEELLKANKADMIGVGRALFRDADWAKKAMGQD